MATVRRKGRNSSSDSTGGSSSDDDRLTTTTTTTAAKASKNKPAELTLKDDEDILPIQAPLPEEGNREKNRLFETKFVLCRRGR